MCPINYPNLFNEMEIADSVIGFPKVIKIASQLLKELGLLLQT